MAGRLPGSSSRHLRKKEGGGEGGGGGGIGGEWERRIIVHEEEEEESVTYFFRAAMAAISCSLSACVVPKYCQPCACISVHVLMTADITPTTLSSSSLFLLPPYFPPSSLFLLPPSSLLSSFLLLPPCFPPSSLFLPPPTPHPPTFLSSFFHPLPPPSLTLMLSGLACTCSTWQFTVSLFYDIIDKSCDSYLSFKEQHCTGQVSLL